MPACRSTFTGEDLVPSSITNYTVANFLADATNGASGEFL
jgi:hypothetical protein